MPEQELENWFVNGHRRWWLNIPEKYGTLVMTDDGEISVLLQRAQQGNEHAANALFLLVEEQLKAITNKRIQAIAPQMDVTCTGLVDEAFCKLVGDDKTTWNPGDRGKFFGYAAKKIEDLLVQKIRSESAKKRGGQDWNQVDLEAEYLEDKAKSKDQNAEIFLELKGVLENFSRFAEKEAAIFRIRYFLGCTFEEIAEILEISNTEAYRGYQKAQLWLQQALKDYQTDF